MPIVGNVPLVPSIVHAADSLRNRVWRGAGADNTATRASRTSSSAAAAWLLGESVGAGHLATVDAAAALLNVPISRELALSIPPVAAGVQTIGVLATLPLSAYQGTQHRPAPPLVAQPDPDTPPTTTYTDTYTDMALYGRAVWQVLEWSRTEARGKRRPRYARWVASPDVAEGDPGVSVVIDGVEHAILTPRIDAAGHPAVIVFDGPVSGGLLGTTGIRAVRTALLLEMLAETYADPGIPTGYLQEAPGGAILTDEQVEELLARWEKARRTRATGYLGGGLEYRTTRLDPAALQLVEARQMSDARIAQALNLPAAYINAPTAGHSDTYTTLETRRRDLIDLSLANYRAPLTGRLTMPDITPAGLTIAYDLGSFLRADLPTLVNLGVAAVTAGLMDVSEWRELAGLPTDTTPVLDPLP